MFSFTKWRTAKAEEEAQEKPREDEVQYKEADPADIDWTKSCLPIGLKLKGVKPPWLELDEDDLKILSKLLRKPIGNFVPAAESESLGKLADWADRVLLFAAQRKVRS